MFKKLVKLQKLTISYISTVIGRKFNWMASSERMVLLPLLHLPSVTSISLNKIRNFAFADLAGCVNLKNLDFFASDYSNDVGNFLEALPPTPVMLERLVIEYVRNMNFVQRLCNAQRPDGKPVIDFSSLKELEISAQVARLDSMRGLFGMCRNLHKIRLSSVSLLHILFLHPFDLTVEREVILDPPGSNSSLKGLFAMLKPSLPTLVDIDIEYYIEYDDEAYDGPLAGLCHELEKMIGQNVVETINLDIWVELGCNCSRWGELDDVLMGSPEGWPALKKVSLSFNILTISIDDAKAFHEIPMNKLVESKRVEFNFEVNDSSIWG